MKTQVKEKALKKQNGKCKLSGKVLSKENELFDTHRPNPKRKGGIYTDDNSIVVDPIAHMIKHGTLRIRTGKNAKLKQLIDSREQVMKLKNKINNQLRAYARQTDQFDKETLKFLKDQLGSVEKPLKKLGRDVVKLINEMSEDNPLIEATLKVRGVGPVSVAYCISYIDLEKARHASSVWAYVGLDKPSHSRYEKGQPGGGNKRLRCVLFTMAESQIKLKGAYREVYDRTKNRLAISEKITKSRNTQGKLIECMWKDAKPSHRHGAAIRQIMKHFLADYWYVGRTLSGLKTSPLYPEAILGGNHRTIMPEERGWKY